MQDGRCCRRRRHRRRMRRLGDVRHLPRLCRRRPGSTGCPRRWRPSSRCSNAPAANGAPKAGSRCQIKMPRRSTGWCCACRKAAAVSAVPQPTCACQRSQHRRQASDGRPGTLRARVPDLDREQAVARRVAGLPDGIRRRHRDLARAGAAGDRELDLGPARLQGDRHGQGIGQPRLQDRCRRAA